ncbi:MAG: class I SAM-dependent methyltransferase, partial [Candidatus Marinimicrobia bacterium]|nr:class I SAM-dependent methyltransferase [Candidatus Neomarinimicrobiota bacterium]
MPGFKSQIQPIAEIEKWFEQSDPWDYEKHPDDTKRRAILKSVIPRREYHRVLDIGCGDGYITGQLPGNEIIGVDIAHNAIKQAREKCRELKHITFETYSLFDLPQPGYENNFDLIIITGVLYPQYLAQGGQLAAIILDSMLKPGGCLVSCHIDEWYDLRFPYTTVHREYYR